jgi:MraZ protein
MITHADPKMGAADRGELRRRCRAPLAGVHWGERWGNEVALFLSTFVNKVDRKGRVSVPATFRAALAGQRFPGIVAFPSLHFDALECCGIDRMEEMSTRHEQVAQLDDYANLSTIFAGSHQLAFDSEGRIILSAKLAEHTGIEIPGIAAFVGQGRMFQIWEPERFEAHDAQLRERARRQGSRLPPLTVPGPTQ